MDFVRLEKTLKYLNYGKCRTYKYVLSELNNDPESADKFMIEQLGYKKYQVSRIKHAIRYRKERWKTKRQ